VNAKMLFRQRGRIVALLLLCLLTMALPASAAVQVQRPILYDGGRLNQHYLWGEDSHHGVDLSYPTGTNVYAVAGGVVMQIRENIADDTHPPDCDDWGNFVLIRHNQKHWDRTTQLWAYVYSLYAHLQHNSVRVEQGNSVTVGQWIAEVDNTGQSTGPHLHFQLCIHPQSDRLWVPDTINQWSTSRNPELWLRSFNYGGINTGTVVGRVSDSSGNPVSNLRVYGLSKPPGSGGTNYVWSETYHHTWANPDDVLVENWGTTDVYPGTYHLEAKYTNGTLYEDLGWHTVEAGRTTYVGLYPIYLPDVNNYYWESSIAIRNNSATDTAYVVTSFVWSSGIVAAQRNDYVAPRATMTINPPWGFAGSATVVSSEDVSVVVVNDNNSEAYAYTGIPSSPSVSGIGAATEVFVPCNLYNYYGWFTTLYVQNTGAAATRFHAYFYDDSGTPVGYGTSTISAGGQPADKHSSPSPALQ